ncbi:MULTISPECIES: hypothetical protein [unclassified Mesorhizobium]|uniref:hypothetical protein n=1 Tax=unclassified Mesorhizobium TaxID=325217 RepID=UPI000FCC65F8|nr:MULTISPECIES: hypothetical protein [unclassified Mesorhizobium]RUV40911.1 hypothetical protein EOD29_26250 [Mesorhizobium sp. M1A.T.Ca.IN.004.03.1.1]RWK28013.1 MAG: hypothetical protein EOR40_29000 [Mesorhizobium sp.]RWK85206.1 MAG: hypothetical protein EOR52_28240 [Mesorhizobium sp.]TIP15294.1 MAG: hypothetical protein E5X66_30640 [Mesorhizobium sp.]TJV76813.1 MAG: hypothetical protein E5X45_29425 [Mesorhizobium sp.]
MSDCDQQQSPRPGQHGCLVLHRFAYKAELRKEQGSKELIPPRLSLIEGVMRLPPQTAHFILGFKSHSIAGHHGRSSRVGPADRAFSADGNRDGRQ